MIVGTAGHIDHGKTALVRALTGVDTDRLPEEKARGISIDLGFAYQRTGGGASIGYVDVPGHERFVHNMLAGATGIDLVLLVVAADDGPMPQTREHLAIVELLGISRGLVVLTKTDLVDMERQQQAYAEIRAMLAPTSFAGADIFPVSVPDGVGIDELAARLESEATARGCPSIEGGFRMAIDRAFTLAGAGLIVTGTVHAGRVTAGEQVIIAPAGVPVRVRGIHAQSAPSPYGSVGQRCAVNIVGSRVGVDQVRRGDWLVAPSLDLPTDRFDARIRILDGEAKGLRHWAPVHLHLGAADLMARVALLQDSPVAPGAEAFAQLVTERPIATLSRDRFILRDQSARRTIGGGSVIDPWPPNRGRRRPERLELLAALDRENVSEALTMALRIEPGWLDLTKFAIARNIDTDRIKDWAAPVSRVTLGSPRRHYLFEPGRWSALRESILDAVARYHTAFPASPGIEASRLRVALPDRLPVDLFDAAVTVLQKERAIEVDGPWLKRHGHFARLAAADDRLRQQIEPMLRASEFAPPRVRDLAVALKLQEGTVRSLLKRQAQMRRVIEVAQDHFYLLETVRNLAAQVAQTAARNGGIVDTAAFRDRIGTGRKIAIQILEYFDKTHLTFRKGEVRTIRAGRIDQFATSPNSE